jgi:hypothetical protein
MQMNATDPKSNPDLQPLTVHHGRKLYDQSKEISQQLTSLAPLLALLDQSNPAEGHDPIESILSLLEALATMAQHQTATLAEIDAKLDILLANSNIEGR